MADNTRNNWHHDEDPVKNLLEISKSHKTLFATGNNIHFLGYLSNKIISGCL